MPLLNYTVQPFRLLVGGGWNATRYVDAIGINTPEPEVGQPITYTGEFEVSYNSMAKADGLTEEDFSQFVHPERWRPDRDVTLELTNELGITGIIKLRIQKYAYDEDTRRGRGTLRQMIDMVDRTRPSTEVETVVGGVGTPLASVIYRLTTEAFRNCTIAPSGTLLYGIWGVINDKVSTRNPISDANRLVGTCWQWFTVDKLERFVTISGDPMTHPILFRRAFSQVEMTPDIDNVNEWASRSIVTGSYQEPAPPNEDCGNDPPNDSPNDLDDKTRPKIIKTTSYAPLGEVFEAASGTTQTLLEQKTILYQYGNSLPQDSITSLWALVSSGMNVPNPIDVSSYIISVPFKEGNEEVVSTMTIKERPAGNIVPSLGTATNLRIHSIELESERQKTVLRAKALIEGNISGSDFTLIASPHEVIDINSASKPDRQVTRQDPNNPNSPKRCLEAKVEPEPRQEAPEVQMKSVNVKGECTIAPTNWAPFVQLPLVTDFGFLPSQGHANYLACQIAARETRRLDSYAVTMPIPAEWIAADMPGYFRCHLHDAEFEATAVTLVLGQNGDKYEMKLRFQANRIGGAPHVPEPVAPPPFVAQGLALQLTPSVGALVGIGGQSGEFTLVGSGGNP